MKGGEPRACPPERLRDLHEAAGVRARVRVRRGCEHVPRLPIAEVACRLGLRDVVDPGGAAAEVLLGWLGTMLSRERPDAAKYAELEVRSLTGMGAH